MVELGPHDVQVYRPGIEGGEVVARVRQGRIVYSKGDVREEKGGFVLKWYGPSRVQGPLFISRVLVGIEKRSSLQLRE